jgi:hypothetical protein
VLATTPTARKVTRRSLPMDVSCMSSPSAREMLAGKDGERSIRDAFEAAKDPRRTMAPLSLPLTRSACSASCRISSGRQKIQLERDAHDVGAIADAELVR